VNTRTRLVGFGIAAIVGLGGPAMAAAPAFAGTAHPAAKACCSSGGRSSGGSSSSVSRSSTSTSTRTSTNTGTSTRTNTGTSSNSGGFSGGGSKPVTRTPMTTGSLVTGGKSTVIANSAASKGSLPSTVVRPSTRVTSGSTYRVAGVTYGYHPASYWAGFRAPLYGSAAYWMLLNDPYYAPNYFNMHSVWYHHPYPVGYSYANGQFAPIHHTPWRCSG